jgi:hypothetical protein
MTRTIDSDQSPLRYRSELFRLDLVRITTYSDRVAETVDTRFYFARQPVIFDWNNEGTDREFWPMLKAIGPLATSINHLPSPEDSELLRKPLEITLSNEPYGASATRLIETLRDGHILENATIEWTQLLLDARPTTVRIDQTALTGDEHTFWYRGRINRVGPITNETITLHCETEIPAPVFLKALDKTKNDPRDYGRELPIVYGEAKRVKAVGYEVGWVTTLAEDISDTHTGNTGFTDLSGISGSGNLVRIESEEVLVTYVSDLVGNITARAQSGTTAVAHKAGAVAIEMITTAVFVVAGHEVDWIDYIYVKNPLNGELVRVTTGYSQYQADTGTISGETVATVKFTQAQFRTMIESLFPEVTSDVTDSVSTQPDFEQTGVETIKIPMSSRTVADPATNAPWGFASDPPTNHSAASLTTSPAGFRCDASSTADGACYAWFPTGSVPASGRTVVRYRVVTVFNALGGGSYAGTRCKISYDFCNQGWAGTLHTSNTGSLELGVTKATSPWETPTADTYTIVDFEISSWSQTADGVCYWITPSGAGTWSSLGNYFFIYITQSYIEVEVKPNPLNRSTDAAISVDVDVLAASMGYAIEIYADIAGYKAPSASPVYKEDAGFAMTRPCDIMRHWIEEIGGASIHTSSYDDCDTNLGGNAAEWGFDARTLGLTWEERLARMAFEARATLVPEETSSGTEWKMLTALSTYAFPAASGSVTEWDRGGFAEADQDLRFVHASRFTFSYAPNWSRGDGEEAFTQVVVANEDTNDLTVPSTADFATAADRIGKYEAEPVGLRAIQDEVTAEEIAGYYCHERIRIPVGLFAITGVPWWEAYDLEVGDIIEVTPPWASSAVKCRVIEYVKDSATEQIELRLVEIE